MQKPPGERAMDEDEDEGKPVPPRAGGTTDEEHSTAQHSTALRCGWGQVPSDGAHGSELFVWKEVLRPDDPRVDALRDVADMDRITAHIDGGASRATVVVGSYIGLELAEALRSRGLETTVVERTDRLMPWLDHEMTRTLHFHVRSHDVDVRLSTSADAIRRGEKSTFALGLSDGTTLEPDVLVLAVGARPNAELAREAGLDIGPRGGIVVDAHMRTSAPDVLAAGDAVETPSS